MEDFVLRDGVLTKYMGNSRCVSIPDGITEIGESAFYSCFGLEILSIGRGVVRIGDSAFSDCAGLWSVRLPDSLTHIGAYAFYDCTRLGEMKIPEGVVEIGAEAFSGCTRLTSIILPKSLSAIGSMAFCFCPLIDHVYFMGGEEDWNKIRIDEHNDCLTNAPRYYYSEGEPTDKGRYWHYRDGRPEIR